MTTFTAALVREQGVTFAVIMAKDHVLNSQTESDNLIRTMAVSMRCPLIVLMGESNRRLRGNRRDVVQFVANLHPARLPWKKWTV